MNLVNIIIGVYIIKEVHVGCSMLSSVITYYAYPLIPTVRHYLHT
jgi:hypothetical protein